VLRSHAAIVPVALDLGIVTLQRAQGLEAGERIREMKAAEEVFLSIRGIAGEGDDFHLFYGQVCWWLGRTADGRAELDALLAKHGRKPDMLVTVSNALRELGARGEARTLAEEAYSTATDDEQRHNAARQCALCKTSAEDEITWLSRCDTANPAVAANLAQARGTEALRRGDHASAIVQLRQAVAAYKALPRSAAALNNAALAAFSLFDCTGERPVLDDALAMMEQAISLQPGDTILQINLSTRLYAGGIMATAGDRIDQVALGMIGDRSLLGYCYDDGAGRAAMVKAFGENPDIRRAQVCLERLRVMCPREPGIWRLDASIAQYTGDVAALTSLRDRLRSADLDLSSAKRRGEEDRVGTHDEQNRVTLAATLVQLRSCFAAAPATAAVARCEAAEVEVAAALLGVPTSADALVAQAEAALAMGPSLNARATLIAVLLFRAGERRLAGMPDRAPGDALRRLVGTNRQLVLDLRTDPGLRVDSDVLRAAGMAKALAEACPANVSLCEWALLDALGDPAAAGVGAHLRDDPVEALGEEIDGILMAYSPAEAVDAYWAARLRGAADPAAAVKPWRDRGVTLPDLE
jgi:tetratricopeptide (TPR) repeat protein